MYILVIGGGKVGYQLVRALLIEGHEVLAIERDPVRAASMLEDLGNVILVGDGGEEGVLREAGATRADVTIAATDSDEDNLVVCQIARHVFGVKRTIALVSDPRNEALFQKLGIDVTVSPSDMVLRNIEEELPEQGLVHVMALRSANRNVLEIRIPREAGVVGKTLNLVNVPQDTIIPLVVRGAQALPTTPEMVLLAQDEIVAITSPEEENNLLRVFTEES